LLIQKLEEIAEKSGGDVLFYYPIGFSANWPSNTPSTDLLCIVAYNCIRSSEELIEEAKSCCDCVIKFVNNYNLVTPPKGQSGIGKQVNGSNADGVSTHESVSTCQQVDTGNAEALAEVSTCQRMY
jgi:hypothetical protein